MIVCIVIITLGIFGILCGKQLRYFEKDSQCGRGYTCDKCNHTTEVTKFVDLGLPSGVLWATCNVGATKPEEYGEHFAWGETKTKKEYTRKNSKTYTMPMSDISGSHCYDVARAWWGDCWRMPTKAELEELRNQCQWKKTNINGVKGYKVTGTNDNSIFLPAAGFRGGSNLYFVGLDGYYWSSTPYEEDDCHACQLSFDDNSHYVNLVHRHLGHSVRPVKGGSINEE